MKKLLLLVLCAGIFSCSTTKSSFHFDSSQDFNEFRTFKFTEDELLESVGPVYREKMLAAVETEMAAKGLEISEDADLLVNVHVKTRQVAEVDPASQVGYGSLGWQTSNSEAYKNYNEYTEGTLLIIMADNETKTVIWQGAGAKILEQGISEDKRDKNISEAVKKILENYPPGK